MTGDPAAAGGGGVPGIRGGATTVWFLDHVPGARPPLAFEVIPGGRSNLTYLVRDSDGGSWVLRRPPLSGVLPSAHDMGREYRIISALHDTPVPIPRAIGLCEDHSVTGAPFYVMDYVDGIVPRDEQTVASTFDERQRAASARSLVEVLVALHGVEPAAVGLGDLGRRDGYVERQLRRWSRQWEQSKTRELPAMEEIGRRLAANVPAQQGPGTIVHGDYRLDNLIVSPAGEVVAVLDWELCTASSTSTSPSATGSWRRSWRACTRASPPAPTAAATTPTAASPPWWNASPSAPSTPPSEPAADPRAGRRAAAYPSGSARRALWSATMPIRRRSRNQGRRLRWAGGRWP